MDFDDHIDPARCQSMTLPGRYQRSWGVSCPSHLTGRVIGACNESSRDLGHAAAYRALRVRV